MNPSFQGVNRLFVLLFENKNDTAGYTGYFLPVLEIKDYNFMIDGQHFFDQPVKNDLRTYDNIYDWSRSCLQNCFSIGLSLFQKIL